MRKANLETSAINYIAYRNLHGKDISSLLKNIGFEPAIGCHTLYELARTFLYPDHIERGKHLFSIIRDLSPSIIPETPNLIKQEIIKLYKNVAVLPFMSYDEWIEAHQAILNLERGFIKDKESEFIRNRENSMKCELRIISQKFFKEISLMKQINPAQYKNLKNFNDIVLLYEDGFPGFIIKILKDHKIKISYFDAKQISFRPDSFPVLHSALRANLYLAFIHFVHKTKQSKDKIDDLRNIIDASYSQAIITFGEKFIKNHARDINPKLEVFDIEDILNKAKSMKT